MKALIWKIRFAIRFHRIASCSWLVAWVDAGAWFEYYGYEVDNPKEAAEASLDDWNYSE